MPTPTPVGSARFGSTFAFNISGSFDVGPDPVSIFALGTVAAGSSTVRANAITLNPGGTPIVMSAGTDRTMGELGANGRLREFDAVASGLTGVVNFTMTCTNLSGVPDNTGKPGVSFWWWKDVVSVSEVSIPGTFVSSGSNFTSPAVSSAAGQVVMGIALTDGVPATFAGINGTVLDGAGFAGDYEHTRMYGAGAASTSLQLSISATSGFMGHMWNLVGAAPPAEASFSGNISTINFAGGVGAVSQASFDGDAPQLTFGGAAGTNLVVRRIVSLPITSVGGILFTNQTDVTVYVYALSGGLIATFTGETTNASGIMEVSSALFVLGTEYVVRGVLSDGVTEFYGRKTAEV